MADRSTLVKGSGEEITSSTLGSKLALDVNLLDAGGNTITQVVDAAATANVVVIGQTAESTVPTEVADADVVRAWYDTFGRMIAKSTDLATQSDQVSVVDQGTRSSGVIQIIDTTLNADPTSATSAGVFVGDKNKVGFVIRSVIDRTAETVVVTYTFEASADNSTWLAIDTIYDTNGTDAPVASVIHSSATDVTLINAAWLPEGQTFQYLRVVATGTDTDADDTAAIDVWMSWQK